jgi:hypothetical protein
MRIIHTAAAEALKNLHPYLSINAMQSAGNMFNLVLHHENKIRKKIIFLH